MNISRTIPIFLITTILVFGTTISMGIPTTLAQSYEDSYGKDYDKKSTSVNKQKVNCNNIIINGVNSAGQGSGGDMINDMTNDGEDGTGQWLGNNGDEKNLNGINENIVNFCKNKNNQVVLEGKGSLTVTKEIFGCIEIDTSLLIMDCRALGPDSDEWLSCDDPNNDISDTGYCNDLQKNFFDIEVTDDQGNVIEEFTGSEQGTTIPDLVPGTYTVNEIVHDPGGPNQLSLVPQTANCADPRGFVSGGSLQGPPETYDYRQICFEIEDQQGNDCSTTTIAAGETKTCIVKNYILLGQIFPL